MKLALQLHQQAENLALLVKCLFLFEKAAFMRAQDCRKKGAPI